MCSMKELMLGVRYRNEIIDPYVLQDSDDIGIYFILMDDNARPHWDVAVEYNLKGHVLERKEWSAFFPDLNPIEHF